MPWKFNWLSQADREWHIHKGWELPWHEWQGLTDEERATHEENRLWRVDPEGQTLRTTGLTMAVREARKAHILAHGLDVTLSVKPWGQLTWEDQAEIRLQMHDPRQEWELTSEEIGDRLVAEGNHYHISVCKYGDLHWSDERHYDAMRRALDGERGSLRFGEIRSGAGYLAPDNPFTKAIMDNVDLEHLFREGEYGKRKGMVGLHVSLGG
jgi:hypothetical protein